ncbi:MAG: FkbM family methyltransferase [Phycisphaerae bacterium]
MSPRRARLALSAARAYTTRFPNARGVSRIMHWVERRIVPALPADQRLTVVTADGRRFDENVHEPWFFNLMMLAARDPAETAVLRRIVRAGDTVIDVGANYGWYATLLARLVGPTGRVHAFEPSPTTMALLRRNCDGNGVTDRITFNAQGLADRPGRATIHVPRQHGGASLKPYYDEPTERFDIELTTLDEYAARAALPTVRVVKLDVEGSEFPIIRGATRLLSAPDGPMLLLEVSRVTAQQFGYTPEEVMGHLAGLRYDIFRVLERPAGRLMPLPDVSRCHDAENVLCCPAVRRAEIEPLLDGAAPR